MAGTLRAAVAVLMLVSTPVVAQAFGFRSSSGSSYGGSYGSYYGGSYGGSYGGCYGGRGGSSYGWGGSVYCAPSYPVAPAAWPYMPPVAAWPSTPVRPTYPSAVPTPAPPSRSPIGETSEPPRAEPKKAPVVNESRSLGGEYLAKKALDKSVCKVGFWNATGRDVQLIVDGQTRMLPRNREIRLDVPRTFAWHVDDGRPKNEQVPTGQSTYEVVIRE